jgi:hypothetical protein
LSNRGIVCGIGGVKVIKSLYLLHRRIAVDVRSFARWNLN